MLFGPGKYPGDAYATCTSTDVEVAVPYGTVQLRHSIKRNTVPVQYIKIESKNKIRIHIGCIVG